MICRKTDCEKFLRIAYNGCMRFPHELQCMDNNFKYYKPKFQKIKKEVIDETSKYPKN